MKSCKEVKLDFTGSGTIIHYHPGGYTRKICSYKNNQKNGPYYLYNTSGSLLVSGNYLDGEKDGVFVYFFENTRKVSHFDTYKNGILHGESTTFTDSGSFEIKQNFEEGLLNGECMIRYKNGPNVYRFYVKGKLEGLEQTLSSNGNLLCEGKYKDDVLVYKKFFYGDGRLREHHIYKDGVKTLTLKYHPGGSFKEKIVY